MDTGWFLTMVATASNQWIISMLTFWVDVDSHGLRGNFFMIDLKQALKLSPNCYTPLSRTPWAGSQIQKRYKSRITKEATAIGESWEVSCDPDFPSQVLSFQKSLADLVQSHSEAMLSPQYVQRKGANCEILIKLLNAASP